MLWGEIQVFICLCLVVGGQEEGKAKWKASKWKLRKQNTSQVKSKLVSLGFPFGMDNYTTLKLAINLLRYAKELDVYV